MTSFPLPQKRASCQHAAQTLSLLECISSATRSMAIHNVFVLQMLQVLPVLYDVFKINSFFSFNFGCTGSLLLCAGFL